MQSSADSRLLSYATTSKMYSGSQPWRFGDEGLVTMMYRISCQYFDSRGNEDEIVMMNYGLIFTKE